MSKILSFWDFKDIQPRKAQITALEWIEQNKDKKYFILQASVGSGKSNIGITASKFFANNSQGESFVLTPQKILQEQYERDFLKSGTIFSLYGKSNYKCANKNTSCAIGGLVKPKCPSCPHSIARKKATDNPNVVLNYKLALTSFSYTETFDRRKLMILDECHTLEKFLVDFDAIEITKYSCEKHNIPWLSNANINNVYQWLNSQYIPSIEEYYSTIEDSALAIMDNNKNVSVADLKILTEYEHLGDHLDSLLMFKLSKQSTLEDNFVLVETEHSFIIKRVTGVHSFKTILQRKADKFLFMSATILDPQAFCTDLGIDVNEAAFLSIDSDFPKENRPVYYIPSMRMNATWNAPNNSSARSQYIANLIKILDIHSADNGIIHTANFQVSQWLVKELQKHTTHQIFHHNPDSNDDRNAVIRAFMQSKKPSILISPSCSEGLDLKDDLGRFAIFAKIAFPFLGDQWILKRKELSAEWYTRKTIIDVMQGCGRVVRSETDTGYVYILDTSFEFLMQQTSNILPKWWIDSIETLSV